MFTLQTLSVNDDCLVALMPIPEHIIFVSGTQEASTVFYEDGPSWRGRVVANVDKKKINDCLIVPPP